MESRIAELIRRSKNEKDNPGSSINAEGTENNVSEKPVYLSSRAYQITSVLRALQIFVLVILLLLTISLILVKRDKSSIEPWKKPLPNTAAVLLFALFTTFIFILSIDMFRRINGGLVSDTTMFLVGVLGFFLFVVAAEGIHRGVYRSQLRKKTRLVILVTMILCVLVAILFLIDVGLTILNWRTASMRVDKSVVGAPVSNDDNFYKPGDDRSQRSVWISDPLVFKDDVRHVTTSVSDYQRPSHQDLANLHKLRKIGVPHRREYMDRPVSAQAAIPSRVVEAQTEPPQKKIVSDVESLVIADTKEERVQTMPKCPVCANNWNPYTNRRADNFGLCPTFLHLTQGFGMCNCSRQTSSVLRSHPAEILTDISETELRVTSKRPQKSDL